MSHVFLEQLSPSQIVLLRGEAFAHRWGRMILPSGVRVSSRQLGETLVKVALLACASQGVLELEIRPQKVLFGLQMGRVLFAEPQRTSVPWPESTLEAWLTHLAAQLRLEERHRVQTLIYVLLRENSPNPWRQIVEEVQGGLVALGVLERMEGRRSETVRRRRVRVAASVADSIASLPTNHVQELMKSCRLTSPWLWRLLRKEVTRGISFRRRASRRQDTGFLDHLMPF